MTSIRNHLPTKRILALLCVLLLGAAIGAGIGIVTLQKFVVYQYSATTTIYLCKTPTASSVTENIPLYQDLLANLEISRDFQTFITSESALVQFKLRLSDRIPWMANYVYTDSRSFFIQLPDNNSSRIMQVTANCDNPNDAALIANEAAKILETLSMKIFNENYIQVLEIAQPSPTPTKPKRVIILLMCVAICTVVALLIDIIWVLRTLIANHAIPWPPHISFSNLKPSPKPESEET